MLQALALLLEALELLALVLQSLELQLQALALVLQAPVLIPLALALMLLALMLQVVVGGRMLEWRSPYQTAIPHLQRAASVEPPSRVLLATPTARLPLDAAIREPPNTATRAQAWSLQAPLRAGCTRR